MTTPISTSAESAGDAGQTTPARRLVVCRECDWVVALPRRAPGQSAACPRCDHHLTDPAQRDTQKTLAWTIATLTLLALVFVFPFLGFSTRGVGHVMSFADTARALAGQHYGPLAVLLLATTVALPGLYLVGLLYVCVAVQWRLALPGRVLVARLMRPLEPWMMADVFIVGVLVSLIKIVSLANIHIRGSFIAFCIYALFLLYTRQLIDWTGLWDGLAKRPRLAAHIRAGAPGRSQSLVVCSACETPFPAARAASCPRCGKRHWIHRVDRIQLTAALLVTASLLYIPANLFPVLATVQLGNSQPQTIAAGVLHLARHGDWPIAAVIFTASIVVPIAKIVILAWLCLAARTPNPAASATRTRLFRITEKLGRWSMIDVFVVAVLTTLVQAGALMSIVPGIGATAFAAVVVLTMIAAHTFDTRLLWPDSRSAFRPDIRPEAPAAALPHDRADAHGR